MSNTKKPTLNIVLPVYNESVELAQSVGTLAGFLKKHLSDFVWHITIADNASTDQTYAIGQQLSRAYPYVSVIHLDQKGRGRAVKRVWEDRTDDYCAYMDIDLSSDLKNFPALVHSLQRGYDIAIGSRNAHGARVYGRGLLRTITSKLYIILIKSIFWVNFTDAQCGFKAVSRKVVQELIPHVVDNEWFFDTEMLIVGEKSGLRIYEEPVTWIDNPGSTVRVWKTAVGDLLGLWRIAKDRPWRVISYDKR